MAATGSAGAVPETVAPSSAVESPSPGLAAEWDDLALSIGAPPFLRPRWFDAWREPFGDGELELHTVRRSGRLRAIAPVIRDRGGLRAPANFHTPLFDAVSSSPQEAEAVARGIVGSAGPRLQVDFVDPEGPLAATLAAASRDAGRRVVAELRAGVPVIRSDGDPDALFASLPKKHRSELRRCRRRLAEQGNVDLEVLTDLSAPECWPAFLELEGSGWKRDQGTSIDANPATRTLYRRLAEWGAEQSMLRLYFLRVAERRVATELCLLQGKTLYMLKGGFDHEYSRFSPGSLSLESVLRLVVPKGVRRIELGPGESPYKLRWTDLVEPRAAIHSFSPGPAGSVGWLAEAVGRPLARRALRRRQASRIAPESLGGGRGGATA